MNKVPALQRGIEIIRAVAGKEYTLPQLEDEMTIPKASFGRLMKCLQDNGFINLESGTKRLSLGDDLTFLSMEAYENSPVRRYGDESVIRLSSRWGVTFVIHEHCHPFKIYWRVKAVPPGGINTRPVGFSMESLNSNAQGQLFLSQLPDAEIKAYFATGQICIASEYTLKTYKEIMPRITETRQAGYAYQERENNAFMKQIAVPFVLPGCSGNFCLTCYMPLDFTEVTPLLDNMRFEAARIGGSE